MTQMALTVLACFFGFIIGTATFLFVHLRLLKKYREQGWELDAYRRSAGDYVYQIEQLIDACAEGCPWRKDNPMVQVRINEKWYFLQATNKELSYEDIAKAINLDPKKVFRMEYTSAVGPGDKPIDGMLRPTGSIKPIHKKTEFTVVSGAYA